MTSCKGSYFNFNNQCSWNQQKERYMTLKAYVESGKNFTKNHIKFRVIQHEGNDWAVCSSTRVSNPDGTNGVRFDDGFCAYLSKKELPRVVALLAKESQKNDIQFILDDEMTQNEGLNCHYYYKMQLLRSPVVL